MGIKTIFILFLIPNLLQAHFSAEEAKGISEYSQKINLLLSCFQAKIINGSQEGSTEMRYLGWQESLVKLAQLVEPNIN